MILGLNTDVRYKGKTFHIQTEDSGVHNPVLITHVFIGGTIIETVRSDYRDALEQDDLEDHVRSLMRGQHRSTYKALLAGDFDEAAKRTAKKKTGSIPLAKNKGPVGIISGNKPPTGTHTAVAPAPSVTATPGGMIQSPSGTMPALPKINSMGGGIIEELDDDDVELLDPEDIAVIGSIEMVLVDEELSREPSAVVTAQAPVEVPQIVEFPTELVSGRPLDPVLLGFLLEDAD